MLREQSERFARRPAKQVDRLVGVADNEEVRFLARQQRQNFDLRKVGILKFIDQQEASAARVLLRAAPDRSSADAWAPVIMWPNVPRFLARSMSSTVRKTRAISRQRSRISPSSSRLFFRLRYPRQRNFAALQAGDIFGIFSGPTSSSWHRRMKVEQVAEKLADVRGAHEVLQSQLANAAAQKYPEVFVVEHPKRRAMALAASSLHQA